MKKIIMSLFVLSLILFGCNKSGTSDNLTWETNFETALQKAKSENKSVLVNFTGSDWCIWCQKLSGEVFSKSEFEDFASEKLILVKIDFPHNIEQTDEVKAYNNELAQRYGIEGYPTVLIFNSQGQVVLRTGYRDGGAVSYIEHLQSYL